MERLPAAEVRRGPSYEVTRLAELSRLASAAEERRVALGPDLVLVFETAETVRTALEEQLRGERVDDAERVASEAAAFAELLGDQDEVVATLYIDVADPVALAERLAELSGVERGVSIEIGGRLSMARPDPGDSGSGAFHLVFALDQQQRDGLSAALPVRIRVEHPACRVVATLSAGQVRAIGADLTH
jgi:hypothetical protein